MSTTLRQMIRDSLTVQERPNEPTRWDSFSSKEWEQTLEWLDLSGLAIYFLRRTRESIGLSLRSGLEKRFADNRLRSERVLQEFQAIVNAFETANVKYAVLKGISLLPDYCPEMELRTQYDHDVLVDSRSLDDAGRALEGLGFHLKNAASGESTLVYREQEPELRFTGKSDALYSHRLGRSIELHQMLWEKHEDRIRIVLPDDFLERRELRQWQGVPFMALCDEDCLLFQILHAFKHILRNWCRLSTFLEIAYFLNERSNDSGFWRGFYHRIENIRWAREAAQVVLGLAEQLFRGAIPADLKVALRTPLSPALDLWIERYGRRAALSNFNSDKCSLFLHREFVDDPSDWAAIRRRRLFPVQRPHRPPAVVFQRGFSAVGRVWMEKAHALRRLRFHGGAGLRYVVEYPRWIVLRRLRLAEAGHL